MRAILLLISPERPVHDPRSVFVQIELLLHREQCHTLRTTGWLDKGVGDVDYEMVIFASGIH